MVSQSAPLAIYLHCYAHKENLILVDSYKFVPEARDFFALLERLYAVRYLKFSCIRNGLRLRTSYIMGNQ